MPWCRESTVTQTLLGTLTRGVILQEEAGDVYATRLCQCAVFFGDKRGMLTKLERLAVGRGVCNCYFMEFINLQQHNMNIIYNPSYTESNLNKPSP